MSLEYVETKELLRELQRRMDGMVFVGAANRTTTEDALLFACVGSFHGCLGLIETAKLMVLARDGEEDD